MQKITTAPLSVSDLVTDMVIMGTVVLEPFEADYGPNRAQDGFQQLENRIANGELDGGVQQA